MEPATVLIAAFEVQALRAVLVLEVRVDGFELIIGLADGIPTGAGVEPNVENVGLLAEGLPATVHTSCIGRKQRCRLGRVPRFHAMLLKQLHDLAVKRRIKDGLLAAFAQEYCDGHAPNALAADAPVGARGNHISNALLAPCRVPDNLVDIPKIFFSRKRE